MAAYLLVAHQTAERKEFVDVARQLAQADPDARFTLLVPATPVGDLLTWDEGDTRDVARSRAQSAEGELKRHGVNVIEAKVGDADPVNAVDDDIMAGGRYDAIVISTFPPGVSRWIKMDVISRLRRKHPRVRIVHVVAEDEQAAAS